ncbi:MAG: hypothetical protein WCJ55_00355 [Chloroflexales bacterium]
MMRTTSHASRRWRLVALLLIAALVAVLRPALAQVGVPGRSPLVPNIEPTDAGLLADGPLNEAAAVATALAAFAELPQPAMPPEGALLDLPADASLSAANTVYLPLICRSIDSGNAPPPATPTPVTPTPVTPTPETPTPKPGSSANIAVALRATPSIWVARGALLEYEIRVVNYGDGGAHGIDVTLPYYRGQYTLESTSLNSKKGDWVRQIDSRSFTVRFGPLSADTWRSGRIFLRVNANLPYQTLLNIRAVYNWDGGPHDDRFSNWAPVLVGNGAADAPYIWMAITPDRGLTGTTYRIFSNRFFPEEMISTWLNTPYGVRPLSLRGSADTKGGLTLRYVSSGLVPGNYQIVFYGNRSGLTGVASFIVL